jgi:hypothetical protein
MTPVASGLVLDPGDPSRDGRHTDLLLLMAVVAVIAAVAYPVSHAQGGHPST